MLLTAAFLQPSLPSRAAGEDDVERYQPGDVVEVRMGDFVITKEQTPGYYLPNQEVLFFEHDNATLASIEVRHGDQVEEGDVLMTFIREEDKVASETRRLRLEEAVSRSDKERKQLEEAIASLKKELAASTDSFDRSRLGIEIKIAEENLRWQKQDSQRHINEITEEIEEAAEDLAVDMLVAPFSGQVVDITGRKEGDRLGYNEYMCRIIGQEPFLLEMDNGNGEYRHGSMVTIEHGPAKERERFQARVVADHSILGPSLLNERSWVELSGIDPSEAIRVINPRISANTHEVHDVLIVPRRAVTRQNQNYYVNLQSENGIQRRYVQVVNWNPDFYWIQDGLAVGDKIVIE